MSPGLADEQRPVAHARKALDVLDHLRVVVGGQRTPRARRRRASAGSRRSPSATRSGAVFSSGFSCRKWSSSHASSPIHEVVAARRATTSWKTMKLAQQDLVHPAERLEAVQRRARRASAVDVGRLAGQLGAGRVDALAGGLEHAPSPGAARASRSRGPGAAARSSPAIATSRRAWPRPIGDETKSARRGRDAGPRPPRARGGGDAADELAQQPVDPHRVARRAGTCPEPSSTTSSPPVELGERDAPRRAAEIRSSVAVDHEHRAAHAPAVARSRSAAIGRDARRPRRRGSCRRRSRAPSRRSPRSASSSAARGSISPKKNSRKPRQSRQPVVPVVLRPALVGVELARRRRSAGARGPAASSTAAPGAIATMPLDPLRMLGGELHASPTPHRTSPATHGRSVAGRVEHRQRVGDVLGVVRTRPASSGRSERPLPRPSNVTTRSCRARYGSAPSRAASARSTRSAAAGRPARPSP